MKRELSGNQAVAYGALKAGVDVAAGYPGTPSSEALAEIIAFFEERRAAGERAPYAEWSSNEKVALEVAAGAAWAGKRAFAGMKMSGANVALDSLISIAYSGTVGGLVIYIADDPGAEAGMPEQDTRMLSLFTNLPLLEPATPRRAYQLCSCAFELSEEIELPVILRSVTSAAHAEELFEIDGEYHPQEREAEFSRNIDRFTKAGARICVDQHRTLLSRNSLAVDFFRRSELNRRYSGSPESGIGIIAAGSVLQTVEELRDDPEVGALLSSMEILELEAINPLDEEEIRRLLALSKKVLILEELEPVVENQVRGIAQRDAWAGTILGKLDGTFPRIGRYGVTIVADAIRHSTERSPREHARSSFRHDVHSHEEAPSSSEEVHSETEHPITFCEGCPHRGTYLALNRALRKTGSGRKKTVVTGDIGCTILGMNPPFESCWTEVSMGSSIGLAQGFSRGGIKKPVIAAIGDSTFFHAGIPQLINAVQHGTELLLIILDNGWTSMTGFQVNPGTSDAFQKAEGKRVDPGSIVQAIGVDLYREIHPFRQDESVATLSEAIAADGVRVVISREECALTRLRREPVTHIYRVDPEKCISCRVCIRETGCPALFVEELSAEAQANKGPTAIDPDRCTGCSLCYSACRFGAISPVKVNPVGTGEGTSEKGDGDA